MIERTIVQKPLTFSHVSRILELKTQYEENVGALDVPNKRKFLTTENAHWFLSSTKRPPKRSNNYDFAFKLCNQYLEMAKLKYVI